MAGNTNAEQTFLNRLTDITEANLHNEQFGVSDLAEKAGISRSQIHRKLKSINNQSVSQFIREVRLNKAKELLEQEKLTVSEIAYEVGFGSPSYFTKCFREHYGYAPGEFMKYAPDISANKINDKTWSLLFKRPAYLVLSFLIVGAVIITLLIVFAGDKESSDKITEKSIAVLPLKNTISDSETQILADGILEDILNRLSSVGELTVKSRNSSDAYRNSTKTTPQIAAELGVSYLLEGTILKEGENIRIYIQLIDAINDKHIWSAEYGKDLSGIFEFISDVSAQIASELEAVLTESERNYIRKIYTENTEAYKLYQKGRFYSNKRTAEDYKKGIEYYEKAIAEDSVYALAYAGLADNYDLMSLQGHIDKTEGNKIAREMAGKALEIDPDLAEAHTVMGSIYTFTDWKWKAGEKEFLKAIELNPNYSTAHQYYAEYLTIMGRDEEARQHIDKALELDPFSFVIRWRSSRIYYDQDQFDEALAEIRVCLDLNQEHLWALDLAFDIYLAMDDDSAAVECFKKSGTLTNLATPEEVDSVYQLGGIDGLTRWSMKFNSGPEYSNAIYYAMLGEYEKTMELLELASDAGRLHPFRTTERVYKNLRSNPRFIAIRKKMGLPPLLP